jgi:3'(2'), 5'-bisphosphate nucleotidase
MNNTLYHEYLETCCDIARDAGQLLMRYFKGDYTTSAKDDKSPVTDADIAANRFIRECLLELAPDIPVVAEEDEVLANADHAVFWLVDPLDGTRSFVRHEPEFSVNIGLIKHRKPVLGVICAPPQNMLYFAAEGQGAFRQPVGEVPQKIRTRPKPEKLVITRSRSKPLPVGLAFLRQFEIDHVIQMSSAIKFGLVAEGQADLYTRFGRTMEWDTAAGHILVEEAGGRIETADGRPLLYGKPGFENPPFIAYGE